MGDTKLSAILAAARSKAAGADPALVWPLPAGVPNRHGAISAQLSSYSRYKLWADKMRSAWRQDDEEVVEETEAPPVR